MILLAHIASDPGLALDLTIFLTAQNVVFEQAHIANHSPLKSSAAGFPIFAFRDEGSMASQTASASSLKQTIAATGQKISSWKIVMSSVTSANTVGSTK